MNRPSLPSTLPQARIGRYVPDSMRSRWRGWRRRGRVEREARRVRTAWGMAQGMVVALMALLLLPSYPPMARSGDSLRDWWIVLRSLRSHDNDMAYTAILAVDAETRNRWKGRSFDARDVGRALRLLKKAGVTSVVLDLPDINANFVSPQDMAQLERDIRACGIVHLPHPLNTSAPVTLKRFRQLARGAAGVGHAGLLVDSDGHVRRAPLVAEFSDAKRKQLLFSLPLSAALQSLHMKPDNLKLTSVYGSDSSWASANRLLFLDNGNRTLRDIPISPGGVLSLNYYLPLSEDDAESSPELSSLQLPGTATDAAGALPSPPYVPTLSLSSALQTPDFLRAWQGRAVVIGVTDRIATPQYYLSNGARVSEATIQAIALDNLLSGDTVQILPEHTIWLMAVLLSIMVGGLVAARPPLWSGLITILALLATFVLSLGLFMQGFWFDITLPCAAAVLTFLQGVVTRARYQERETTRVASAVEALERTSEIVSQQAHADELLQRVLNWTLASTEAESATVYLREVAASDEAIGHGEANEVEWAEAATDGSRERGANTLPLAMRQSIVGHVLRGGYSVLVRDARRDPRFQPENARRHLLPDSGLNVRSVLCVPLKSGRSVSGVILVVNRRDGMAFSPSDLELLEAVANQASIALDNARLYALLNQRVKRSESDLERTNRRLEAERNTLQAVLESMTDGVVVTDGQGRVQIVNPAARELLPELEASEEKTLAECLPDVASSLASSMLSPQKHQAFASFDSSNEAINPQMPVANGVRAELPTRASVPMAAAEGQTEQALFTSILIRRGDTDAPRLIEARSAPLQSEDGTQGLVAVFADVTEERAVQQAKSDFVSFVAHEMRSPLTSISGFSSMLQRQETGAAGTGRDQAANTTRARYLGIIYNESERLTRLINNLLDVARIEAGRGIELQFDVLDFTSVAHEAIESQRVYSTRHTLVEAIPPGLPLIRADRDKLLQIVINLLSNAMKYSPGGEVTLAARVLNGFIEVSVRDQGPGIAPDNQQRLFQRFGSIGTKGYAARNPGTGERAKPTGTGLGLFLTRHLVESHGGRIRVESEVGQGATFIFSIPVADQRMLDAPPRELSSASMSGT